MKYLLILILLLTGCFNEAFTKNSNSHNTDNTSNVSTTTIDEDNTTVFDSGTGDSSCADIRPSDGDEGFLYKPVSDADGKLVVLLPASIDEASIESLCIARAADMELDCGILSGRTNGDRPTYRFPLTGAEYSGNLIITEVTGVVCEIEIFDNAARQD